MNELEDLPKQERLDIINNLLNNLSEEFKTKTNIYKDKNGNIVKRYPDGTVTILK